jgi:hypothetical protein
MLDNSKKLSIAITDTYALLTYHINEESKINIILSDKDIVRINTNISLNDKRLYELIYQFIKNLK